MLEGQSVEIDVSDTKRFTKALGGLRLSNDLQEIVEKVKLQRDKSQPDGGKCQNHKVRLTPRGEELYAHLRSL